MEKFRLYRKRMCQLTLNINKLKERLRESKVKHRNKYDRDDYTPSPLQADNISKMKW